MSSPTMKTTVVEVEFDDGQKSNHLGSDAFLRLAELENLPWQTRAAIGITLLAKRGDPFTVEDVRKLGMDEPEHHSAWGHVFQNAQRDGVIVRTGFMNSPRKPRHGAMVSVWVGREAA